MALLGQLFTVEVGLTGSVWKDLNVKLIATLASKELEIPVPHSDPIAPDQACFQLVVTSRALSDGSIKLKAMELSSSAFTAATLQTHAKVKNMLREENPLHVHPIIILGEFHRLSPTFTGLYIFILIFHL